MSRAFTPKVVTASDLLTGEAVYLTEDDAWSPDHAKAELLTDEAHADIRLLLAKGQPGRVVDAYLAEAKEGPNGPEPVHFREAFRTRGPSNYAHGKQEQARD